MGLVSDIVDIFLIVFLGTYYTIKEINFVDLFCNWKNGTAEYQVKEARKLLSSKNKNGLTAVVTGANGGLGLEIATNLSSIGYRVILGCRSKANATQAIEEIHKTQKDALLEFIPLDLSSFDSIEEFTKQLESKNYKIDLLVNNAGLMFTEYTLTRDGFEMQMGVNHFGHFKLTMLLLPLLVENSRVLTVTSITCLSGTINFSDINASRSYSKFRAYANSKLANIHFTKELARRLKASNKDIVAYGINPGSVHTNIVSSMPWFLGKLHSTFGPYLLKTPFEGSATAIFAAVSDDIGEKESGETYFEAKISHTPVNDSIESRTIGKKLWEMSEELTHSKYIW